MSTILNLLNLYSCYTYIISQLFIPSNYLIGSIFMHKYNAFQYFHILNALFCSVCSFCSFYSYTWDIHIQSNLFTFFLFLISIIIFKTIEKEVWNFYSVLFYNFDFIQSKGAIRFLYDDVIRFKNWKKKVHIKYSWKTIRPTIKYHDSWILF